MTGTAGQHNEVIRLSLLKLKSQTYGVQRAKSACLESQLKDWLVRFHHDEAVNHLADSDIINLFAQLLFA